MTRRRWGPTVTELQAAFVGAAVEGRSMEIVENTQVTHAESERSAAVTPPAVSVTPRSQKGNCDAGILQNRKTRVDVSETRRHGS